MKKKNIIDGMQVRIKHTNELVTVLGVPNEIGDVGIKFNNGGRAVRFHKNLSFPKFNVGDKVRIKVSADMYDDSAIHRAIWSASSLARFNDKVMVIDTVDVDDNTIFAYDIETNDGAWWFNYDMCHIVQE